MTEEEFLRNQREIFYDRKFDAQIAGVAERMQESSAASPFGENPESPLGALGGGELGGGELGGGEGETPELGGGAEAGAEAPAEEPGALLAAPGGGAETPAGGEEGGAEIEPGQAFTPADRHQARKDLLAYCGLDTEAMVEIVNFLI